MNKAQNYYPYSANIKHASDKYCENMIVEFSSSEILMYKSIYPLFVVVDKVKGNRGRIFVEVCGLRSNLISKT